MPDQFRDDRKESAMTQTSKPQSAARSRLHLIRFHGVLAPMPGCARRTCQGRCTTPACSTLPRTLAAASWRVQDQRRHRGACGDCQDTHASGFACLPARRRAHRRGRCLFSKQPDTPDTLGENGSATAPTMPRGLRLRMAVRVHPNRSRRVDAATNKPDREGSFHKTSRKWIADRFSVWWYRQCMEKKGG